MQTINYITYDSWWDTDQTILCKLCQEYKVNVFVLNFSKGTNKYKNKDNFGFNIFVQEVQKFRDRDPRSVMTAFSIWIKIRKHITKDSLNIFVPGQNLFLLFLLYFLPIRKTCICYHNYIEHIDSRSGLLFWIKNRYCQHFQKFIFYSQGQVDAFMKDYPSKKVFLLTMPLKDYGNCIVNRNDNTVRFLFFGYIREYKRLDIFIKAANLVKSKKARFYIAGNTNSPQKYESMIHDKSKFDLRLRFIDNKEIPDLFAGADYLVLPYEDSTQSGPSLVAINYSLPIIASDLPSFRSLIQNGQNGFLFKFGDSEELATIMDKVCSFDAKEKEKIVEGQRRKKIEYQKISDVFRFFNENLERMLV